MSDEHTYCSRTECGKLIPPRVRRGGPARKYCSSDCRLLNHLPKPPDPSVKCAVCDTIFLRPVGSVGKPRLYCNDDCKHEAQLVRSRQQYAAKKLKSLKQRICKICKAEYEIPTQVGYPSVYCSSECRAIGHQLANKKARRKKKTA